MYLRLRQKFLPSSIKHFAFPPLFLIFPLKFSFIIFSIFLVHLINTSKKSPCSHELNEAGSLIIPQNQFVRPFAKSSDRTLVCNISHFGVFTTSCSRYFTPLRNKHGHAFQSYSQTLKLQLSVLWHNAGLSCQP